MEAIKTTAKKPGHPSSAEMVKIAIGTLNERGGSSMVAIKKYISANYTVDIDKFVYHIKKYLRAAVETGELIQTKGRGASGSFKLSAKMKTVAKKKKVKVAADEDESTNKQKKKVTKDKKADKSSDKADKKAEKKVKSAGKVTGKKDNQPKDESEKTAVTKPKKPSVKASKKPNIVVSLAATRKSVARKSLGAKKAAIKKKQAAKSTKKKEE